MKKLVIASVIALLVAGWSIARAQDFPKEYIGLPGDNLNLYAVMKLFQESETFESFERDLNDENSRINNLDLNGDRLVDYIMVMDYVDGNVHTVVLRVALDRNETQDVAVFTIQQFADGSVQLQLVGDEALYGRNYIIEPYYDGNGETSNPAYVGTPVPNRKVTVVRTTYYEVAAWPLVAFIYRPAYVVWRSSWYWGYYPTYWHPWRPFYWHAYYGYHHNLHHHYYAHYRHWDNHRYHRYNNYYYDHVRTYSPTVVVNINKGNYKNTYSRPDTRKTGERLYARSNSGRSSATTSSGRVRTTDSGRVNKSATTSGTSAARRSSQVTNGRTDSNRSTEIQNGSVRRSSGRADNNVTTGSDVRQRESIERKSGTIATERNSGSNSSVKTPAESRRSSSGTSSSEVSRPLVNGSRNVTTKPVTTGSGNEKAAPVVTQSKTRKATTNVTERNSTKVQKSTAGKAKDPATVKSTRRTQSVQKSAPVSSSSRSSKSVVSSSNSGRKAAAQETKRSSSRSGNSEKTGRR